VWEGRIEELEGKLLPWDPLIAYNDVARLQVEGVTGHSPDDQE
jgi:hypothetical protein